MPNWKFYDKAANLSSGLFNGQEFAREWDVSWLLPGYTFQADIPNFNLLGSTTNNLPGGPPFPDAVNPSFWVPKYQSNHPDVLKRGTPIPQNFYLPGHQNANELFEVLYVPNKPHYSLFGESHLWHDTWNNRVRWRSPNIIWAMPADLTPVQHLIWFDAVVAEPVMLLSMDSPLTPATYELDWSGGLYGTEEDRFGIILDIVEA